MHKQSLYPTKDIFHVAKHFFQSIFVFMFLYIHIINLPFTIVHMQGYSPQLECRDTYILHHTKMHLKKRNNFESERIYFFLSYDLNTAIVSSFSIDLSIMQLQMWNTK